MWSWCFRAWGVDVFRLGGRRGEPEDRGVFERDWAVVVERGAFFAFWRLREAHGHLHDIFGFFFEFRASGDRVGVQFAVRRFCFAFGPRVAFLIITVVLKDRCASDRKSTRLNSSHLGISYAVF